MLPFRAGGVGFADATIANDFAALVGILGAVVCRAAELALPVATKAISAAAGALSLTAPFTGSTGDRIAGACLFVAGSAGIGAEVRVDTFSIVTGQRLAWDCYTVAFVLRASPSELSDEWHAADQAAGQPLDGCAARTSPRQCAGQGVESLVVHECCPFPKPNTKKPHLQLPATSQRHKGLVQSFGTCTHAS